MFNDYEDVVAIDDVCAMLNIGRSSVYALLAQSELHGFRCGRVWKIPTLAVEEYVLRKSGLIQK